LGTGSSTRPFKSCLLVAESGVDTLPVIRALHGAGIAVLERAPGDSTLSLAVSGEFDVIAWHFEPSATEVRPVLARLAAAHVPCVTLLTDATPAVASLCLEAGADACLQLDTDAMLIVAQVHAVLRRHSPAGEQTLADLGVLQVGDLVVDVDRCEVERGGVFVALTASEFRILEYMARNAGRVLRPHEILNAVSEEYEYLPREAQEVFKVYVRRIRRKLEVSEENPRYLVNVRGFGYRLEGGSGVTRTQRAVAVS
jgi:DNA-binding response OmpR family regulator